MSLTRLIVFDITFAWLAARLPSVIRVIYDFEEKIISPKS